MANLEAQPEWPSVRQLETHELARGGLNGNMNEQAKALVARTEYLNQEKANKSEIVQGVFEFSTYDEFNSAKASLPLNCTVIIGEENTTGTGIWGIGNNSWNGIALKKSTYDPVQKSNDYTDLKFDSVIKIESEELSNKAEKIQGKYVHYTGMIELNPSTEMISVPVESGKTYAIYSTNFNKDSFFISFGTVSNPNRGIIFPLADLKVSSEQQNVKTFTIPSDVSYMYINTLLPSFGFDIRNIIKINEGLVVRSPYIKKINNANLYDSEALHSEDLSRAVPLYSVDNNYNNKFVRFSTGNIETSASATVMNVFPVEGGQTYSINSPSYANGYFAIAFRESSSTENGVTLGLANLLGNSDTRTFVAPDNAKYAFMNVVLPSGNFNISDKVKVNKGNTIITNPIVNKIKGMDLADNKAREDIILIQELVNNNEGLLSSLKGKKWLAIGDSITHKNDRSHFNYHYYLAQIVGGMTIFNYGVSGSGFFTRYGVADTITQTDIDFITIFLGTNDWGNQTAANKKQLGTLGDTGTNTISGCINTLLLGLINKFPLIPIAIFTPLPRATNYGLNAPDNAYGYNLKDLVDLLHEYATHYSLPILDLYSISNLYPWLPASNEYYFKPFEGSIYGTNPDGLHPNDAGHQVLARKMKSFLESI